MRPSGSVDLVKTLAIICVISGHAVLMDDTELFRAYMKWEDGIWQNLVFLFSQAARFSVPCFFVLSGYLWGQKANKGVNLAPASPVVVKRAKRIFFVFVAWSAIYLFPFDLVPKMFVDGPVWPLKVAYWRFIDHVANPMRLMLQGTRVHLWYLIALLWALAITSLFASRNHIRTLIAVSVTLYIIGVFGKAYANTGLGFHSQVDTRNGPFFSTVFFVSGYLISQMRPNGSWALKGSMIFLLGFTLHLTELYILWREYGINLMQDYVFGTYLMGLGAAMVALSNHSMMVNKSSTISVIGTFSLGIYAIHFIFVDLLKPLGWVFSGPAWSFAYASLVLLLSLAATKILSKFSFTREIVQ
ncbi:acyltransferase [Dechloromonas sp. H13]|uniref:acyltransferase n=1 Tax=Dechloromonas sp. H13 TaxID=2570193 RepID=UPI001292467A|nr:acyltransferase [Dechloromonas sp. H13]